MHMNGEGVGDMAGACRSRLQYCSNYNLFVTHEPCLKVVCTSGVALPPDTSWTKAYDGCSIASTAPKSEMS